MNRRFVALTVIIIIFSTLEYDIFEGKSFDYFILMCITLNAMVRPQNIVDLSFLTEAQVETLRIEVSRRKNEITMEQALRKRKISGISRGAYYRVLRQARNNIKASLFTLVVAVRMGIANAEDVQKLILSASSIPDELDSSKAEEVVTLVNALAERIVILDSNPNG
jgi:signal transduction histidine kinase